MFPGMRAKLDQNWIRGVSVLAPACKPSPARPLSCSPAQKTHDYFSVVEHLQQKSEDREWLHSQALLRVERKPFPQNLTGVGVHPFFPSHKIALAQVLFVCVPVAVVKIMPFLENIQFNQLSFLDGKKPFLKNAFTCCTEHILIPVHNFVASEGFFIAVGFCETLILA